MAVELEHPPLAPSLRSLLAALRKRIRGYVWAQGLAATAIAVGAMFWITLAFDWLFEPPWQFRAVLLTASAGAIVYVVTRYLLVRIFRRLDDTSMAVLLERRFSDYSDSLITTVELGEHPEHATSFGREMLSHTAREALQRSQGRRLADVFNIAPLVRAISLAAILTLTIICLGIFSSEALGVWLQRVVLLDRHLLWPRDNHVRVEGFPADRVVKVAKGSDLEVVAVADLTGDYTLPETVEVRYRTDEGARGRDTMSTVGVAGPNDAEQKYSYQFKGIMSPITFDVLGGDDRDRDLRIEVVDSPTLAQVQLRCEYPGYTGRARTTLPASGLVQLPVGTKVTVDCQANKDLVEAVVTQIEGESTPTVSRVDLALRDDHRHFQIEVPPLASDVSLLFELHDADGIRSRDPVRLVLAARPDDAPAVGLRLRGISNAVTPQARLPVVGEVSDDYGLARVWFEYQLDASTGGDKSAVDSAHSLTEPLHLALPGVEGRPPTELTIEPAADAALDLKRLRERGELLARRGVRSPPDLAKDATPEDAALIAGLTTQEQIEAALSFQPQVGQKLTLMFKAADNCELPSGENIGQGERYQLEVVAPEQLLSMLEGRELVLRRRFETIYQEMMDTRDLLARVDFAPPSTAAKPTDLLDEPEEPQEGASDDPTQTPEQRAERARELRELRIARALDNSQRAAHETGIVADSFDEIREEMANNRVDTPELQHRLKDQIADPLHRISNERFPQLQQALEALRTAADDTETGPARRDRALAEADAILVEMKLVLDKMLELETFNEVIDALRQIISSQEKLNRQTLERQKEDLKNKLRDLED